jgi:hypothetical protein
MSVSPVPPGPGARFERAIGALEVHHQRLARLSALFPSFKQNSLIKVLSRRSFDDRDERFANGRLEAGGGSDSDGAKARRPLLPTPVARAASGHKPAEA